MPSQRHRSGPPVPPSEPYSDSDEFDEELDADMEAGNGLGGDEGDELDDEEEEEEEEEPLDNPFDPSLLSPPVPSNFREVSTLASWTVSSSKPGCSVPQLRSPLTSLFWQSDGPQPHYLNIHFFKLVRLVGLRLYLDFEADESYTPTRIVFLAGSGQNDLVEWSEMRLEQPRGWIWVDFSDVGNEEGSSDEEVDEDEPRGNGGNGGIESESESLAIPGLADALAGHDDEDDENALPGGATGSRGRGASVLMDFPDADHGRGQDFRTPDARPARPPPHFHQPHRHHHHHEQHTPTNAPTSTPTLARNGPRVPFQSLHTESTPPSERRRNPKLPVLRCHLLQIKILENHQNGKDTHLRGLQVFARDDEGAREKAPPVKSIGSRTGMDGVTTNRRNGGGGAKGLGRSKWDVEGSIR